jgi:hypothetical protein
MIVNLLQREASRGDSVGYRALGELIERSHERAVSKSRLRRRAAAIFRSLRDAGIVQVQRAAGSTGSEARVHGDLQLDFSLHDALALYLVEAVDALDPDSDAYALEVLSVLEATLENPRVVLQAQIAAAKTELMARLKAEGVPYEDRIARLEKVEHPKPESEFIYATFVLFAQSHPWVGTDAIHPKSIAREIYESHATFLEYTRTYGLARSEGVLLRYLSQVHNTLVKSVPLLARTDAVIELIAFFRTLLARVDSSLVEAWENLLRGPVAAESSEPVPLDLAQQPRLLAARIRTELHSVVRALSVGDYEAATQSVRQDASDPWTADRFADALAPYLSEYKRVLFGPQARQAHCTRIEPQAPRRWRVYQTIVDPVGDGLWAIEGEVDLTDERDPMGPLVRVLRIGS